MMLLAAFLLAALLGFTAHSAGICAVKAVSEVIATRRGRMLASFAKTVLWVMTGMLILSWLTGQRLMPNSLSLSALSLLGGFVFGIGAALNGGCAVSTVTRLGNGELRMLATVLGMSIAIAVVDRGYLTVGMTGQVQAAQPLILTGWSLKFAGGALIGWALWEATSLWRGRDRACGLLEGLLHRRWRLSLAAAVIGLANVGIAAVAGHWAYTSALRDAVRWRVTGQLPSSTLPMLLFGALMTGVVFSALLRRTWSLRCRPKIDWIRNLSGGLLMGYGVVAIPGGNDGLLLDAIPSLSPHALPAFIALLVGVASVLLTARRFSDVPKVDCDGDICREH